MKRYIKSTSENGRKDAELLATDGSWELWTPHTFEASIYLARKGADRDHWARWDTAYEGNGSWYFDQFSKKGPLYIFINKVDPIDKYQYHAETNSFYDWDDRPADFESFICEHPAFAEFFGVDCNDVEACDKVNACGDQEYFANMVNAASDLGTYEVFAYYDDSYRGLACNEYVNTLSEVDELVNKYASSGYCIRVKNHDSGTILEFTPDNWFNELLPDGGFCALDGLL